MQIFPPVDAEGLWRKIAELIYTAHGGSGLNLTLADVWELEWHRLEWWYEWLEEKREAEAKALERANRASSRRR